MDTAKEITIEYLDDYGHNGMKRVSVKLSRPYDIFEISDLLVRKVGKRPGMLSISGNTAIASY
jgi:hypothetical protein